MLGGGDQGVVGGAVDRGEDAQSLLVVGQELHSDVEVVSGVRLGDIDEVAFHCEIAATRRQISPVHADEVQEDIAGLARQLHEAAVVHVAVVVHPVRGHVHFVKPQRAAGRVDGGVHGWAAVSMTAATILV